MARRSPTRRGSGQDPSDAWTPAPEPKWPGERLGLPQTGRASLASWWMRITALVLDWAACMAIAVAIFSPAVLTGNDWRRFMIIAVFFVETTVLSALTGGSFGQLITRIAILRLDGEPLGFGRAVVRAALVSLAIPALIIDGNRRGLQDLLVGTVVVNRR